MAKPLIMVVDDEREFADNIAEKVNKTGKYEAIAVYSAKEAMANLAKNKIVFGLGGNKIKLILLDIKMPDMDGLQFLEEMRKKHNEDSIGVIMLTAFEDEEKWEKATAGFVVGYVKKFEESDQLMQSIEKYFSDPAARYKMTLSTFEKHIKKREEWEQAKP